MTLHYFDRFLKVCYFVGNKRKIPFIREVFSYFFLEVVFVDVTPKTFLVIGIIAVVFIMLIKWLGGKVPVVGTIANQI